MKGKLLSLAAVAALAIGFASSGAQAQSAKFAASWSADTKFVQAEISSDGSGTPSGPFCTGSGGQTGGGGSSGDACILAVTQLATIDVAQQKDLLIGVSAQIGLVTFTQAKGKNTDPTLGSATASGAVGVTLAIFNEGDDPLSDTPVQVAAPGAVVFASRLQTLKVDLGASWDEEYLETIVSLLLDTTAAHHFNFIGVDLDQGVYDIVAIFDLSAWVAIVGEDAAALARVNLGPRIVTTQEVRAVKGELDPL